MSDLKPLQAWTHVSGPNPWKLVIILEELGLPYEHINVPMAEMKQEPYVSVNPNGRAPALRDPNNGDITLWESGAIIDYLIDVYDKEGKLHYTSGPEKYTQRCWEHFQMSGQGPYFGQLAWFTAFHPEKIPSAIERYTKEALRVTGVIDAHLKKQGTQYLVGDRVTYADLMFITWYKAVAPMGLDIGQFTKFGEWFERISTKPSVVKAYEIKEQRAKEYPA